MRLSSGVRSQPAVEVQEAQTRRIDPADLPRDLPEAPVGRPRNKTPSSPILPARLPAYATESDAVPPAPVGAPVVVEGATTVNSTGWFGLNVGTGHGEQQTSVAKVVEPIAPAPQSSTVAETVANLTPKAPRGRKTTSEINEALTSWTSDYAPTEQQVEEVSATFRLADLEMDEPKSSGKGWIAAIVVVLLAAVTALIWLDSGPAVQDLPDEPPMMRTYRRAVSLIDEGRKAEAMALLAGLHDKAGMPAEALLQLAVLEIEQERYLLGRSHLERYLDNPSALQARRAKGLYAHVFGKRAPQQ